jgi:hypothetical protein
MQLLQYSEEQLTCFCASWLDDGLSFVIRDPEEFIRSVAPKFFKGEAKFSSFKRKLHRWGFKVVMHSRSSGPDDPLIIFQNECFQRDRPEMLQNMRSITAAATRKQANPKDEPDLYSDGNKQTVDQLLGLHDAQGLGYQGPQQRLTENISGILLQQANIPLFPQNLQQANAPLLQQSTTPQVYNGTAPHVYNGTAPHAYNGTAPHAYNGTAPHAYNGTAPHAYNGAGAVSMDPLHNPDILAMMQHINPNPIDLPQQRAESSNAAMMMQYNAAVNGYCMSSSPNQYSGAER